MTACGTDGPSGSEVPGLAREGVDKPKISRRPLAFHPPARTAADRAAGTGSSSPSCSNAPATMSEQRLKDLVSAWQQQRRDGRDVLPEELCRDCPELAEELRQ